MPFLTEEPHGTAKALFLGSAFWFLVGTLEGLTGAVHLAAPDLLGNISWLVFGRIRPVHTSTMIFGFVGSALLGAAFCLVPMLSRVPLWSERLGKVTVWLWNLAIVAGTATLALGHSQSREYAEWIWPVDVVVLFGLALVFLNLLCTVAARRENTLYISAWYILAALVTTFFIYFFGNAVWNPRTGAISGMPDAILAWFYGHGVVGLFLTPLAVAVAYYVVPNVARSPLYSHTLSLVGFWSLLMIYTHIGAHHLLQTPIPTWLKVLAVSGSIAMVIPVATVLVNLWLTMRGRLGLFHEDPGGKFVMAGLVWYLLVCLQGPLQSLPVVQRVTHLNNWVVAHAHMGVLGFAGTIGLGGMYFLLPRVTGRPLHSRVLADLQYWLVLLGMAGFFVVLTAAGLVQGNSWLNGETVYRTLPMLHPYMVVRVGVGVLLFGAAAVGLYNVVRSLREPEGGAG
ncbi:MAG: cbb3-type cytochrome c oxidase subunit I [Deltaproteobacteria bacterium]|nr:cbb3-type cytochrome c oxidase subunit I [Deltaproteobacteria bacterium]